MLRPSLRRRRSSLGLGSPTPEWLREPAGRAGSRERGSPCLLSHRARFEHGRRPVANVCPLVSRDCLCLYAIGGYGTGRCLPGQIPNLVCGHKGQNSDYPGVIRCVTPELPAPANSGGESRFGQMDVNARQPDPDRYSSDMPAAAVSAGDEVAAAARSGHLLSCGGPSSKEERERCATA